MKYRAGISPEEYAAMEDGYEQGLEVARGGDAAALRRYADWVMAEVSVWDEQVYPNRWDKAREMAAHARARADELDG